MVRASYYVKFFGYVDTLDSLVHTTFGTITINPAIAPVDFFHPFTKIVGLLSCSSAAVDPFRPYFRSNIKYKEVKRKATWPEYDELASELEVLAQEMKREIEGRYPDRRVVVKSLYVENTP